MEPKGDWKISEDVEGRFEDVVEDRRANTSKIGTSMG